jgi:hypothetical protein
MNKSFNGAHRHARTGLLYTFVATYEISGPRVAWSAKIRRFDELKGVPHGTIDISDGDIETLAPQAITASVNSAIDSLDQ